MAYVIPFIMDIRTGASDLMHNTMDLGQIDAYIRAKRTQGLGGFGFMHVLTAAYVRLISQRPGVNRFISGQRIYQRNEIVLSLMVKKRMELNAQETSIKVVFDPTDTATDVYTKMEAAIEVARKQGDSTHTDFLARTLQRLPRFLMRGFIGLMKSMDYFGIMPKLVERASPFHASIFISNLGSLGVKPIYHHLYDFGNIPVFITFGAKYNAPQPYTSGVIRPQRFIDYTVVVDERIADGHYLASAFKYLDYLLYRPEELDKKPSQVVEDID
jgi:hypothetical protein